MTASSVVVIVVLDDGSGTFSKIASTLNNKFLMIHRKSVVLNGNWIYVNDGSLKGKYI
jgi:hypothetical protein